MVEINNRVFLRRKKREEELRLLKEEQMRKEKEERERQRQQEQEKQGVKGILGRPSLTMNDSLPGPKNRGQSIVSIDSDNEFDRENNSHIHKTVRDSVSEGMGDLKKLLADLLREKIIAERIKEKETTNKSS